MTDKNKVFPEGYSQFPASSDQTTSSTQQFSTYTPGQYSQQQQQPPPAGFGAHSYLEPIKTCSCGAMGYTEHYTDKGWLLIICCFPWGFFCHQDFKYKKCVNCKKIL